jgi:hypothetical protein
MQQRQPRSRSRRALVLESLESRTLLTTSVPAYLIPAAPGVAITPLLTTGDSVGGYRMAGIPDGLGAFDNGDGTFTVLMNHELRNTVGVNRAHGNKGAFVSKWVIDKATGNVLSGQDQIKSVFLYDPATASYVNASPAFNRFCSANLAAQSAFFNPATGLGTRERIFANGEEAADGRAFAHIVSTGETFELPGMGNVSYENVAASPYPQNLTIVGIGDDANRLFTSEGAGITIDPVTGLPIEVASEVYFYVGQKKSTGSIIDRAGLTGGILHGLKVGSAADETAVHSGDRFTLASLGDVSALDNKQLQDASIAARVTQFRRPEDGSWDPTNPNVYYFVTTDIFGGDSRLWKLTFDDITHPELGGKIDITIDSPAARPGEMFDNIDVNPNGDVLLQEDVGNNVYLGQIFQYDVSTGDLFAIARHDARFFLDTDPATPGVQPAADADPYMAGNQGTQDEESSGIIDISNILGPGHYLVDVQAHYANSNPELVEGGQLLLINTNAPKATLGNDGVLTISGTVNDDRLSITRRSNTFTITFNGQTLGAFNRNVVKAIALSGEAGSDILTIDNEIPVPAILDGGIGDDALRAGGGRNILIGGLGHDALFSGVREDVLLGDVTTLDTAGLRNALAVWSGPASPSSRAAQVKALFADKTIDDGQVDFLTADRDQDLILDPGENDVVL